MIKKHLNKENFIEKYHISEEYLKKQKIDWQKLKEIYEDFNKYKETYETQAEFIASTLRAHNCVHTVKSRVKNSERLIDKIIRKTESRKSKYGDDFEFSYKNYKDEITDLIGVRVIHIFKEDWENIHNLILKTWNVIEITANVRDGDDTKRFMDLDIEVRSRKSGYRSVHYLIEFFPTNQRVIAEIQVRTIFEEGYGEIDHQLRYSHKEIPEVLAKNLLLFNRIVGSADEMASLINLLSKDLIKIEEDYDKILKEKNQKLNELMIKLNNTEFKKSSDKEILTKLINEGLEN